MFIFYRGNATVGMIVFLWPRKDEDVAAGPPGLQPGAGPQPGLRPDPPHREAAGGPEGEGGPPPHHLRQEDQSAGSALLLR